MDSAAPSDVDAYITRFPKAVQGVLRTVRKAVKEAIPQAEETISYQMPVYKLHGPVVYFAAFNSHYSFFGAGSKALLSEFREELAGYVQSKGTIRFPYDEPVPVGLIKRMARFRLRENKARAKARGAR